ncbi:hypothetical protein GOP47_0007886 [Adiantum capillus-veneris]|uniref:BHLH domain-containing protein n=1 Tax=Adiantum capillus-veneris TaxID=13818 RepID=A0A9D4V2G2_ADICA|nr:hypothetical protein GOP47_0007886 [Adiantum capillus-veneris]
MVNITSSTKWSLPNSCAAAGAISSLHSSSSTTPSLSTTTSSSPSLLQNSSSATFSVPPSPPCLSSTISAKPGSVLGLKSCHLSLPPSIADLDLHTHSSRRFIEAIVSDPHPTINKPRSAGSFRLEYESFSKWSCKGKLELIDAFHEGKPISVMPMSSLLGHGRAGRFRCEEDPISDVVLSTTIDTSIVPSEYSNEGKSPISSAIHWATPTTLQAPLNLSINGDTLSDGKNPITTMPPSTVLTDFPAVFAREPRREVRSTNAELEGDLAAAEVDLLPMPGLVSLASPLYDSYLSVSPTDSRMTRISSSDYLSTANSSKTSSKIAPDYLGLPPETLQEENLKNPSCDLSNEVHDLGCPIRKGTSNSAEAHEIEVAASNSTIASSYPAIEDDNFAESHSLAGLWSAQDEMNCDSDSVLHGSEGLASILIDLSHKAGGSTSRNCNNDEYHNSIGSEFMMDDLAYLMMPGNGTFAQASVPRNGRPQKHIMNDLQIMDMPSRREYFLPAAHCSPEVVLNTMGRHVDARPAYPNFEFKEGGSSLVSGAGLLCKNSHEGSSILAPQIPLVPTARSSEASHVGNCRQNMSASSIPMDLPILPPCLMNIGKKRPFPSYEHQPHGLAPPASPSMFNPNLDIAHILATQPLSIQHEKQQENQAQERSYSSATQAFSAMLYKEHGGRVGQHRFNWAASSYMNNNSGGTIRIPPSKARRRHGTAMDPQSIAARTRREKFSDRIRILQSLVPNGERLDTVSMLGQTLEYVRFLQHQVWQLYHGMDPASNIKSEKWKDFLEPANEPAAPT